jgi:hypothetical protein
MKLGDRRGANSLKSISGNQQPLKSLAKIPGIAFITIDTYETQRYPVISGVNRLTDISNSRPGMQRYLGLDEYVTGRLENAD